MDKLFAFIGDISDPRVGGGDTFVDRVNCRYTPMLLLVFALLVTTKNYVGEPIACWCPDHFTKAQVDYTNQVCWVHNTYFVPFDERLPKRGEHRNTIGYYQWVALLLCMMSVMFYLPRIIWRVLHTKSGVSVSSITDAAIGCQRKMDSIERDKTLRFMTKHMGRFLAELARRIMLASKRKVFFYKVYGNYLVFALLFVKGVYFINVVGQLFLLNHFLGTKYNLYGLEVLQRLVDGGSLSDSRRFPRVTMCDLDIRVLGNVQPYTVMCALPVNLFNEIIFIFVWFWLIGIAIATVASFLYWLITCVVVPEEVSFIKARLIAMDKLGPSPDHMIKSFVNNYLRNDGILIVQLVSENSSDIIAAELICGLWDHFRDNRKTIEKLSSIVQENIPDGDDEDALPKFTFDRADSTRPLVHNEDSLRKRPPPPNSWPPGAAAEVKESDDDDDEKRPPIPPKPDDRYTPSVAGRIPFRLPQESFDREKARKDKLERERREREQKDREARERRERDNKRRK